MKEYPHLPVDITAAIDQFESDVKSGKIRPWNPDIRDEYHDMRAKQDMWLACYLASKLTPMQLGYMLFVTPDDKSVTTHQARYLTAPQM